MIELIAKDRNEKFQFEGKCKLTIDSISKLLLIEPFIEEFKMISAMFKWKFVAQKNILFVFAEYDFQDFALIFNNSMKCKKIYDLLVKKGANSGNPELIKQRFLPPLFNEISTFNESNLRMKEIFVCWINLHKDNEKKEYIQISKNCNVYDLFYPNDVGMKRRNLKRKAQQMIQYSEDNGIDFGTSTTKKLKTPQDLFSGKIITQPNFEVVTYQNVNKSRKRLLIFPSSERKKCYEYYWAEREKHFRCCYCAQHDTHAYKHVYANIHRKMDGTQYVKLGPMKHICEMRDYKPEKFNFDPTKDIAEKSNFELFQFKTRGIQKIILVVFCQTNKKLCYEYSWAEDVQRFYCVGCRVKASVTAVIRKNQNGEEYIKFNKTPHICDLREFDRRKYLDDIIVMKPMYEIIESFENGRKYKHLYIFTSNEEKKMCYKFTYSNANRSFYCSKCALHKNRVGIFANCLKNENDEEYISIRNKMHVCQPIEYHPEKREGRILKAPEYQFFQRINGSSIVQKLLVFTFIDNEKFYFEYTWHELGKVYVCYQCTCKKHRVVAKNIKNDDGQECIQLGWKEHVCEPQKYDPNTVNLKIVKKPNFVIEKYLKNGVENSVLYVFDPMNKNMAYRYSYTNQSKKFHCRCCRNRSLTATLLVDENGEEYIVLNQDEHECQPKPFSERPKNINLFKNFKIMEDENKKKTLYIFNENNQNLCYIYKYVSSKTNFMCKKCDAINHNHPVIAKLKKTQNGEDYLELGQNEHFCEPELYETVTSSSKKIFKPGFDIQNRSGKKKLIIYDFKNGKLFYQLNYMESSKGYYCTECKKLKTTVTAKVMKDKNGENYVELGRNNHICQPKKLL